jgi:predicted nucleotidyltransferase component of viral defense system
MISKQDILDRATEWQLRPEVVEKDYVLGWLLCSIGSQDEIQSAWVFKGGTCIKKTYFETYRFSEDLDFTLGPDAAYEEDSIRDLIQVIVTHCSEISGIEFPVDQIRVIPRHNKAGQATFQGRIYYRGPLQRTQNYASIIFDITKHETIVVDPTERPVFHPYPDEFPAEPTVRCYSLAEVLAEKTRALYERTRPRDLYDVVYLLENCADALDLNEVRRVFQEKCRYKGLHVPSSNELQSLVSDNEELRSEWANMLAHQLPHLPDIDDTLARFQDLVGWIDEGVFVAPQAALPSLSFAADETSIGLSGIQFWGSGLPLETIRFAGANRLLVEFDYHGKHRVVEPYSLRRAQTTGNVLLYAWELSNGHIKAFKIREIERPRATSTGFTPRYQVELSSQGPTVIRPRTSSPRASGPKRYTPSRRKSRSQQVSRVTRVGPTYVYECPYCNKRFRRQRHDPKLNPHKTNYGSACHGRMGYLVDTIY